MFRFRFDAIARLRENERDAARASLAEAIEAMKLHEELTKVTHELEAAELRWSDLQQLLGE